MKFLHLGEEEKDCLSESSLSYTVNPRSACATRDCLKEQLGGGIKKKDFVAELREANLIPRAMQAR